MVWTLVALVLAVASIAIGLIVVFFHQRTRTGTPAPSDEEHFNFPDARDELSISDEELKKLVMTGKLRGFRAGNSMTFRRDEVLALRAELNPGKVEVRKAGHAGQEHCPFCHDQIEPADLVVCVACLARHHEACWNEHLECSACGGRERLTGVETTPGRARGPGPVKS